ncbi:MAG: HAD family hydrolase, partial [Clostridia bacterium]|nr:HAD family hydrolase [Clostridia bacterium]
MQINNILDVQKHIEGVKAVIFDLDDTLYSEKEYVRSGFRAIAKYFNNEKLEEKLWSAFLNGDKAIDTVFQSESLIDKRDTALHIYRFHKPDIHLYYGVYDMIINIKRQCKIGIITDGRPEGQRAKLSVLGLEKIADEIIITDELGGIKFRKPNETAFIKMKEKI